MTRTPRKGGEEPSEAEPSYLTVDKEEFRKQLEDRIFRGMNLYNKWIPNSPTLAEARDEYSTWDDYNLELLKRSFNSANNEYRLSYDIVNAKTVFGTQSFKEEEAEFRVDVKDKVANLKRL